MLCQKYVTNVTSKCQEKEFNELNNEPLKYYVAEDGEYIKFVYLYFVML